MSLGFTFDEVSSAYFITIRGTVIRRIFWMVLLFIVYSCGITLIHIHVAKLGIFNNLLGILGIIISLLLGFRANNALSRYNEGRAAFALLKKTLRGMAQGLWIHVPVYTALDLIEKKTIVNLLDGYGYALKHYLREEYSYDEPDLRSRTAYLPRFAGRKKMTAELKAFQKFDRQIACEFKPPTNIPQEILYALTLYSRYARTKNINIHPLMWRLLFDDGINSLESTLGQLEALQRTPIPICYASLLEHVFWIYLLALPFQILGTYGWYTVPMVTTAFFFFIGTVSISLELEDPFGYDDNDLPLDDICQTIRKELSLLTGSIITYEQTDSSWLLSPENQPLLPYSDISAEAWADKSMESALQILADIQPKAVRAMCTRKLWRSHKGEKGPVSVKRDIENPALRIGDENV